MHLLTHLWLLLTLVFVARRRLATSAAALGPGAFGRVPHFDKFLGMQGLFHSLVTLLPVCLVILAAEWWLRGRFTPVPVIVALVGSHLLLEFDDGGPVPLLFPLIESGVRLQYPTQAAFSEGVLSVAVRAPLVALRTPVPRSGYQSFGFINGTGVSSLLLLVRVYSVQDKWVPSMTRRIQASGSVTNQRKENQRAEK